MQTAAAQGVAAVNSEDAARTRRIREAIRERSREIRRQWPGMSEHQSAIGLLLQLIALGGMLASAALYAAGTLPFWAVIPLAAFFASIAHEIEHDLIHKCYFATKPRIVDALLALGWLLRPSTVNPWVRRRLHLLHHKVSGTAEDIEEQAITNGMPMGLRRLLVMTDGLVCGMLLRPVPAGMRGHIAKRIALAYFPLGFVHVGLMYGWLALHAGAFVSGASVPDAAWMRAIDFLFVVWIAPNLLRTISLHFLSSNMHYFGDIEAGNVLRQTQVLNRWYFFPLQAFCMNFGSTHGIHHFHVPEPFYLRQMTAPVAHRVMRENGVRFNDVGSMWRANRWGAAGAAKTGAATNAAEAAMAA